MFVIYLGAGVVALAVVTALGLFMFRGETPPEKTAPPPPAVRLTDTLYLKDFVIDCMDGRNTLRVVSCDVAVVLRERCDVSRLEGDQRLREVIYRVTKKNGAGQLAAARNRDKIKREMGEDLNRLLGGPMVRSVYFSKLVIL